MNKGLEATSESVPAAGRGETRDGERLRMHHRLAATRIEQVAVTLVVELEEALVVADVPMASPSWSSTVASGPGWRGCWMPTFQGSPFFVPSAMTLPPMFIRALLTPLPTQDFGGAIQRHALEITAEIDRHLRVPAGHLQAIQLHINDARTGGAPRCQRARVGEDGFEFVGLETPQANQRANARIESSFAPRRNAAAHR